ncbi:hypothetical protein PIROE2DRAFT_16433 [Piromyces sp. E2]|nr:hypothetical protein PIROE2DRAFT_16433 [Piromyces sp. E2]|eukprot:OUM58331.1 hypothetical protein PIROE2DRAFT_16433 [Piromyces sp. E2]
MLNNNYKIKEELNNLRQKEKEYFEEINNFDIKIENLKQDNPTSNEHHSSHGSLNKKMNNGIHNFNGKYDDDQLMKKMDINILNHEQPNDEIHTYEEFLIKEEREKEERQEEKLKKLYDNNIENINDVESKENFDSTEKIFKRDEDYYESKRKEEFYEKQKAESNEYLKINDKKNSNSDDIENNNDNNDNNDYNDNNDNNDNEINLKIQNDFKSSTVNDT